MKRLLITLTSSAAFLYGASAAQAVCTKPSGSYVGSGSGIVIAKDNSHVAYQSVGSMKVRADGYWETTGWTKIYEVEKSTSLVAPSKNKFNNSTCTGELVNSNGDKFYYAVGNNGNEIMLMGVSNPFNFAISSSIVTTLTRM